MVEEAGITTTSSAGPLMAKAITVHPLSSLKYHIEIIKGLEPTPGRKYTQEKESYVVPDITVSKEGNEFTNILCI